MTEHERVAAHEAGHAAMAVVVGCSPFRAQVGGLGYPVMGAVWHLAPVRTKAEDVRALAMVSLAGWLGEGKEPPVWRVMPHLEYADAQDVTRYVEALASHEDREPQEVFDEIEAEAKRMASTLVYRCLETAFTAALTTNPVLGSEGIAHCCRVVHETLDPEEFAHAA